MKKKTQLEPPEAILKRPHAPWECPSKGMYGRHCKNCVSEGEEPSVFQVGSSTMRRTKPLPKASAGDPRPRVAKEARDCQTHSRRAVTILQNCCDGYRDDGQCHPEEALCLLAAVDDAARAARAILREMGHAAYVEEWEEMVRTDATRSTKQRPKAFGGARTVTDAR